MSLHSVYNIVALAAFALGAAALITAAILFVSQRLWEVMSDRRKRPASAHRTGSHTAKAHTPPQPTDGWNTTALNRSANAADGTRPMNGQSSFAPGTRPMNGQANTAPGTMPMNSQANAANSTTLLNSQADVAAGTTLLKAKPTVPPSASGGTNPLKAPPTAPGGTTMRRVTPGASAARAATEARAEHLRATVVQSCAQTADAVFAALRGEG